MDYCLSWLAFDHNGCLMIWHNGAIDGMHAVIGLIPEKKIGAVILSNYEDQNLHEALFMWAMDSLLGEAPRNWSEIYRKFYEQKEEEENKQLAKIAEKRIQNTSPSLPLEKYAGDYTNDIYGKVSVTYEEGGLVFRYSSMLVGDMGHWHYDTFRTSWRDEVANERSGEFFITFNLDENGTVKELGMADIFSFERVPEAQDEEKPAKP
jgi:hypothetical protein